MVVPPGRVFWTGRLRLSNGRGGAKIGVTEDNVAKDRIRIGCGAGFADDRIPPGVEIVEKGELDYLAMECLAERTIARETLDRAKDPTKGYTPVLLERMEAIMPPALQRGIRIVTNMGAANPMGAARA